MNRYKLSWVPSVDDFAVAQDVVAFLANSTTETTLQAGIALTPGPDGRCSYIHPFTDDIHVQWWVRTHGDNTTESDSVKDSFDAVNPIVVSPATSLAHAFVEHIP